MKILLNINIGGFADAIIAEKKRVFLLVIYVVQKKDNVLRCKCNPMFGKYIGIGYSQDLTGERFGDLVVLGFEYQYETHSYWRCRCVCGNEVIKSVRELHKTSYLMCDACRLKKEYNSLNGEIWKDIVGYEGLYQVSNLGRVQSLNRFVQTKNGKMTFCKGRVLKEKACSSGNYKQVCLCKNGEVKDAMIHQLVAQAFLPPKPSDNYEIDHINNNAYDNRAVNLQWMTHKENLHKSYNTMSPVRNFTPCLLISPDGVAKEFKSIAEVKRYQKEYNLPFSPTGIARNRKSKGYTLITKVD